MIIDAARMSVGDLNPRTLGDLELIEQEAPKRGIWHRPPKSKKNNANTKGSTRRAGTPKRGIWHRPQKRQKKEPKHERQEPTRKKHPSEGFGIAPKKDKKKPKHERLCKTIL